MHPQTLPRLLLFLFSIFVVHAASGAGAAPGSASLTYQNQVSAIAARAMVSALAPRLDQLLDAGGVKCTYRISAKGQVESVNVSCPRPNRFVRDTCVRVIKSTKFPPIPAAVMSEQKKNWLVVTSQI